MPDRRHFPNASRLYALLSCNEHSKKELPARKHICDESARRKDESAKNTGGILAGYVLERMAFLNLSRKSLKAFLTSSCAVGLEVLTAVEAGSSLSRACSSQIP